MGVLVYLENGEFLEVVYREAMTRRGESRVQSDSSLHRTAGTLNIQSEKIGHE